MLRDPRPSEYEVEIQIGNGNHNHLEVAHVEYYFFLPNLGEKASIRDKCITIRSDLML